MNRALTVALCLTLAAGARSEEAPAPSLVRPGPLTYVRALPGDFKSFFVELPHWGGGWGVPAILVSTAGLLAVDGKLYEATSQFGRRIGIEQDNAQVQYGNVKLPFIDHPVSILELPTNTGSAMYFLGNGWFSGGIWAGFLGAGLIADNTRALNTAGQMFEAIICTGITGLAIKMSTGHEDPGVRSSRNGKWTFFPSPVTYLKDVTHYDAMPTGHLATLMATTTVIAQNYPEQWWIRPVGYGLMGLLGFQMVNSGVHWFGDYPIGIGIGYAYARLAYRRAQGVGAARTWLPEVHPAIVTGGAAGLACTWRFESHRVR